VVIFHPEIVKREKWITEPLMLSSMRQNKGFLPRVQTHRWREHKVHTCIKIYRDTATQREHVTKQRPYHTTTITPTYMNYACKRIKYFNQIN